jgi:hypothetical protein
MAVDLSGTKGDDLLRFIAKTLLNIQGELRLHTRAIITALNEVRDEIRKN